MKIILVFVLLLAPLVFAGATLQPQSKPTTAAPKNYCDQTVDCSRIL